MVSKAETLRRLQTEILLLQGFKPINAVAQTDFGLGHMLHSFPDAAFPFSALHEFICDNPQQVAASGAFVTGLLSTMLDKGGIVLWIGTQRQVFPPALKAFGVNPDQIIFVNVRSEKEAVWTLEEALKSTALTSVVGQIPELHFTESRRLQLAIEGSGVGCFLIRYRPRNLTTACTTRWQIKPISSSVEDRLPGLGFPRWRVNLLKVRSGKPGSWDLEWAQGRFRHASKLVVLPGERQTKTG